MPDLIGRIEVPEVAPSGTFPLEAEYPLGRSAEPAVAVHRFEAANGKIEQRFLLGPGRRRWFLRRPSLSHAEQNALVEFWEARSGPYQPFTWNTPNPEDNGATTTARTVAFEDEPLTLERLEAAVALGLTLVEVPSSTPSYAVTKTVERFPDAGLEAALLAQEHEIIPLLRIRVAEAAVDDIRLSDRRCVVGGALYLPRLLGHGGVGQTIAGASDEAAFELGNADGVLRELADDTQLVGARVEFLLYHVGSETLIEFWAGRVWGWDGETASRLTLRCSDPLPMRLAYPRRTISRRCWKEFDDGEQCPFTASGSLNGSFPEADAGSCDKGWDTPNGCRAHNMTTFHGGTPFAQDRVRLKAQNTGLGFGVGRKIISVSGVQNESAMGQPVPEVWTDRPVPVVGMITHARDEQEFFNALAIVSEGPIVFGDGHRLDGQAHHGPGALGLRTSPGATPSSVPFGLTSSGDPDPDERSAGTAFIELRRTDEPGLQLTQAEEHELIAVVSQGLAGWVWTGPGARSSVSGLTNPVWVAVNAYLRAKGLETAAAAVQEGVIDVPFCVTSAGYADTLVDRIVGSGQVKQFQFVGVIREQRPLRDWLTEILANAGGYWTFKYGKLRVGLRVDSVAVEAYTQGNIIDGSLQATPTDADQTATRWTYEIAGLLADSAGGPPQLKRDEVTLADDDAARELDPLGRVNHALQRRELAGTVTLDQAARLVTTRLREAVGGVTAAERRRRRKIAFETTVLALASEPGQVVSVTHPRAPGGAIEMRIERFTLLPDYSVRVEGVTSVDSMYDLTVGSTAADVEPDDLPEETTPELVPAWVENFNAQEDPYIDPKTGQTLSLVTVAYDEPTADASPAYRGVELWVQEYDGTEEGTPGDPIEEPRLITKIARNSAPEARRFTHPTTERVLRVWAPSYGPNGARGIDPGSTPNDFVLLDGKDSAPTQPANPHCQVFPDAIELSAEKGPEPDLDVVLIAFTGDKIPWDLSEGTTAIKDSQVIAEIRAAGIDGRRWRHRWRRATHPGVSDGTVVTLDDHPGWEDDQWLVETADGVFTGVNARFLVDGQAVESHPVLANGADTLTFAASSVPAGRVRVRLGGPDDEARFFAAQRDKSGNVSQWASFPPCSPLAPDGTTDNVPPDVQVGPQLSGDLTPSFFTVGVVGLKMLFGSAAADDLSGKLGLLVVARAEDEAEDDPDLARMNGIRGLRRARVEIEYSATGQSPFETYVEEFEVSPATYARNTGLTGTFWRTSARRLFDVGAVGVNSVKLQLENGLGVWGPQRTVGASFVPYAGLPVWTGSPRMVAALVAGGSSGTVAPNVQRGATYVYGPLSGSLTVNVPTSPAPSERQEIRIEIIPNGHAVTWGAGMKGAPAIQGLTGVRWWTLWRARSTTVMDCIGAGTVGYEA